VLGGHCLPTTAELTNPTQDLEHDDGLSHYNRIVDVLLEEVSEKQDVLTMNVDEDNEVQDREVAIAVLPDHHSFHFQKLSKRLNFEPQLQ
jgi:hypothetical protein